MVILVALSALAASLNQSEQIDGQFVFETKFWKPGREILLSFSEYYKFSLSLIQLCSLQAEMIISSEFHYVFLIWRDWFKIGLWSRNSWEPDSDQHGATNQNPYLIEI